LAYPVAIVLVVVALLDEVIAFLEMGTIDTHSRAVLSLLLHVDAAVLQSTPKIMKVLGGDFSSSAGAVGGRNVDFFDEVFQSLPDATLFAISVSVEVDGANGACAAVFGEESLIGRDLGDVFDAKRFGKIDTDFFLEPQTVEVETTTVAGEAVSYEVTSIAFGDHVVVRLQDVTEKARWSHQIDEERAKSDDLLRRLLPPSLPARVLAGETNISFVVQSASIAFFNVVSFGAWCASHDASRGLAILNRLYKLFDEQLAKRPTITKLRCIGDCYMSAAGLFLEMAQPAVLSREMVGFGLAALDCVKAFNAQLGEALQIRVGVNTGGPISAGVLGVSKPSFEILGPAVSMAREMEQQGVAGLVHCPRSVYELIYGDQFVVREKGETATKQGAMITYVVSGLKKK
jgi:class 3 adenylate cyclase